MQNINKSPFKFLAPRYQRLVADGESKPKSSRNVNSEEHVEYCLGETDMRDKIDENFEEQHAGDQPDSTQSDGTQNDEHNYIDP